MEYNSEKVPQEPARRSARVKSKVNYKVDNIVEG
jgi:hypothetical protein